MRKAVFFLVGLSTVCSAPVAAAPKPAELIIGKWEALGENKKAIIEFAKGGEVIMLAEPEPAVKGKYKFLEDELLEVEFVIGDKKATQKLKIKVDKDTLETTDESKKVEKFKRVK
jgi:uncharacterized protein (TIGR03066 family)